MILALCCDLCVVEWRVFPGEFGQETMLGRLSLGGHFQNVLVGYRRTAWNQTRWEIGNQSGKIIMQEVFCKFVSLVKRCRGQVN